MKKSSIEKKIFTTKQALAIVLVVVAVIVFMGSTSFSDFCLKLLTYGITSVFVVILAAKFLGDEAQSGSSKVTISK
jgi:hypothetical protein